MSPSSKRHLTHFLLATLACLALAGPAQAQWKWRDGRGQIHVSDLPPPRDVPDKDVLQRPEVMARRAAAGAVAWVASAPAATVAGASAAAPGKAAVDPELEERRRRTEQEQAARTKAEEQKVAAVRKENCQRAREQIATLDTGQRLARVKPDGEREILDDDARAREARRAREVIAIDCR